jgi:hypothetical protein
LEAANKLLFLILALLCLSAGSCKKDPPKAQKGIVRISVRMYTEAGAPADSAKVFLSRSVEDAANGNFFTDALSDQEGNALFTLDPGTYYCIASYDWHGIKMTSDLGRVKNPDTSKANGPLKIDVGSGEMSAIAIMDDEVSIGPMYYALTVNAKIGNKNLYKAQVGLYNSLTDAHSGDQPVALQNTGDYGTARFQVTQGTYYIVATWKNPSTGSKYSSDTTKIPGYKQGSLPNGPQTVILGAKQNVEITSYLGPSY